EGGRVDRLVVVVGRLEDREHAGQGRTVAHDNLPRASTLIDSSVRSACRSQTASWRLTQGQMWFGITVSRSPTRGRRSQRLVSSSPCSSLSRTSVAPGYSTTWPCPDSGALMLRSLVRVFVPASMIAFPATDVLTTVQTIVAAQSSRAQNPARAVF